MKYFTIQHEGQQVKLLRREKDHNLLVGYLEEDTADEVLADLNSIHILDAALQSGEIDGMTVVDGKLILKVDEGEKVQAPRKSALLASMEEACNNPNLVQDFNKKVVESLPKPAQPAGNTHRRDDEEFDEQFEGGVK